MKSKLLSGSTAQRLAWGVMSVVLFYEYFRLLGISVQWHYNHPLVWPTWLLGLVSMEMAILYDHPMAIKIRRTMDKPCHIAGALYIFASGILLWMIKVGWDGCLYNGESQLTCMKTLSNTWVYFPVTNPSFEMVLISFRGFGGQDEILGAFATLLIAMSMVWIMNVMAPKDVPQQRKILSPFALLTNAEAGYYFLYTVTQNVNSLPGAVAFFVLAIVFLMLTQRQLSAESREAQK